MLAPHRRGPRWALRLARPLIAMLDSNNPQACLTRHSTISASLRSVRKTLPIVPISTYKIEDGGGIRGYSSLIIMRHLMQKVAEIEREIQVREGCSTDTSYHPVGCNKCVINGLQSAIPDRRNGSIVPSERINSAHGSCEEPDGYLPCHYFDYIGGTSTGG